MEKQVSAFPKLSFPQCIDTDLFHESEQEYLTQFSCPINLGVFSDPVCMPCCGNTFCKPCIMDWINLKKHCPTCRKTLTIENIGQPVLMVRNLIMAKRVYCKNKKKGCLWSDTFEKLFNHYDRDCEFNEYPCTYCGTKILKNELDAHEANCERKPVNCQYCKNTFLLKSLPVIYSLFTHFEIYYIINLFLQCFCTNNKGLNLNPQRKLKYINEKLIKN